MKSLRARARRGERGAAFVEILLVAPVLLLLAFGIIDFGFIYSDQIEINQGVRETARVLSKADYGAAGCGDGDSACVFNSRVSSDLGVTSRWIIAPGSPEAGLPVTVCAEAELNAISPLAAPFINGKTVKSMITMRVENNIELGGGAIGTMQSVSDGAIPDWCINATP